MKHLGVLEKAGLITTLRRGRFKDHYLNVLPLQETVDRWIEPLLAKPAARATLDLTARLATETDMLATPKPDFVMETFIRCAQDALWDTLTDADAGANFHFMANHVVRDGTALVYCVGADNVMLICTETALTPKTRIESTFAPKWAGPDMAQSRFVYEITPEGAQCKLRLEHSDIEAGQNGVSDGWARMLAGLKTWLETGEPANFGGPADIGTTDGTGDRPMRSDPRRVALDPLLRGALTPMRPKS